MSALDVLPDSRLQSDIGAVMIDWPLPNGKTVRTECVPTFCANCGKDGPFCPRDNTTWTFWLCQPCFDKFGALAGTLAVPDHEFWKKVEQEMLDKYGRALDQFELAALAEQGWGPLAKLVKESPIKVRS